MRTRVLWPCAVLLILDSAIAEGQQPGTLEAVRAYLLSYDKDLPDYTCVQETHGTLTRAFQFADLIPSGPVRVPPGPGRVNSEIEEELSLVGGKETYKVTRVNGARAVNTTHEQVGGTTSSGEYGS